MTIDQALADLSIQLEVLHRVGRERSAEAIKLGIEALKDIKSMRAIGFYSNQHCLPGETP